MFEKYGLSIGPMMLWSSIFALIFGIAPAQIPIPGTACSLALDPVTWLVASPSVLQVATFDLVVPGPVLPATIYTQALVLDPPNYASSNGIRIDFR